MLRALAVIPVLVMLALSLARPASAENGMAIDASTCLKCHGDKIPAASFAASVHGKNACTSCHVVITEVDGHTMGAIPAAKVKCSRCHKKEAAEHYASVHMLNDINCTDCHGDIHSITPWKKDKRKVIEKCQQCHDQEASDYLQSSHGKALMAGKQDSPACNDCHGLHEIKPLGDRSSPQHTRFHSMVCMKCHSDEKMMKRNGVFTLAVETYEDSYHGKNFRLGYPERVAGCADCHTAHKVLPASDPASSVSSGNLLHTCRKCHANASTLFTKFHAHGEPTNREKYPILYWTFISMSALLAGVFAVFWVHTILWMFRGFVENRQKLAALHEGHMEPAVADGHRQYRRFSRLHIFLHFLVITSFLGLALTGLPLKFSNQEWATVMISIYGGTANAGLIHRICAVITFVYFFAAIAMSFRFLFISKEIPGNWLQRLFGPDSLFPNRRDIRDVTGMVRWFLFKGPKPTFERWTYWEKFDFFAVFWGMFAIGGSGMMLWFPEFFGTFLPGWMFNVATIIHSDEALLATGFIFTVHFFNTHGRPEKFPMDFVIFNGQISKQELCEERRDQWQRYEEAGVTEKFAAVKPSGVWYDFLLKGFGFLALFTGIILLFLMIYALLT
ncbi:MAG: cytochrome C [Deltaproteobacteria bacterium]|nr:cytochrome C [Deltaproteobacteria bacterium]